MNLIKIVIPVTQQHLDTGAANSFQNCAIAEAMKALFLDHLFGIWDDSVEFISSYKLALPRRAVLAIAAIDRELAVAPFSFELELDLDRFDQKLQEHLRGYRQLPTDLDLGLLPEHNLLTGLETGFRQTSEDE